MQELEQASLALACRYDFRLFSEKILKLEFDDFHIECINKILEGNDILLELPRGHGKTTLNKAFIIWKLWREQKYRILIASSSLEQSAVIMEEIQDVIEETPELKSLVPKQKNDRTWNSKEIWLTNGNRFFRRPFTDSARGPHVNLLILDDILRTEDITDEKMHEILHGIFFPMTETLKGQKVIVGTPMRIDDEFSRIKQDPYFTAIHKEGVITDSTGKWIEPLWKKNRTLQDLERTRLQMGNLMFSREIMCNPLAGGSSLFTEEQLRHVHNDGESLAAKKNCSYYCGWDVAMATGGDSTVFTVLEKDSKGFYNQVRMERYSGWTDKEQIGRFKELHKKFNFTKALIEENGLSKGMAIELTENDVNTRSFTESFFTNRNKKEELISGLQGALDTKTLFLLDNPILLKELRSFGIKKDKTGKETYEALSGHDDCVISLALALKAGMLSKGRASFGWV